jgi:hypothetical protein
MIGIPSADLVNSPVVVVAALAQRATTLVIFYQTFVALTPTQRRYIGALSFVQAERVLACPTCLEWLTSQDLQPRDCPSCKRIWDDDLPRILP